MKSITASEIPSHKGHFVYILRCSDGTYYTGYTTELRRRIDEHNEGKGAKYTRGRGPVELMYIEEGISRSWAQRREESIKRLPREKKESLICGRMAEQPAASSEKGGFA
jgi:putative endonuclease